MKSKQFETILYSAVGVGAMFVLLTGFNIVTAALKVRVDLTKEKAYTLSAGTKAILKKIDTPVKIRFYCTQPENPTPETVFLRGYAQDIASRQIERPVRIGRLSVHLLTGRFLVDDFSIGGLHPGDRPFVAAVQTPRVRAANRDRRGGVPGRRPPRRQVRAVGDGPAWPRPDRAAAGDR